MFDYCLVCTQGYMVGNGVTDPIFDGDAYAFIPFVHGMGLISDTMYEVCLINIFRPKI